jgi:hypothetical protein
MLLAHSHWDILHHLRQNFFSYATSCEKNMIKNYVIITKFSVTVIMKAHYSMSIQIQEFKFANKMGVNEDYHLLGCNACSEVLF